MPKQFKNWGSGWCQPTATTLPHALASRWFTVNLTIASIFMVVWLALASFLKACRHTFISTLVGNGLNWRRYRSISRCRDMVTLLLWIMVPNKLYSSGEYHSTNKNWKIDAFTLAYRPTAFSKISGRSLRSMGRESRIERITLLLWLENTLLSTGE